MRTPLWPDSVDSDSMCMHGGLGDVAGGVKVLVVARKVREKEIGMG